MYAICHLSALGQHPPPKNAPATFLRLLKASNINTASSKNIDAIFYAVMEFAGTFIVNDIRDKPLQCINQVFVLVICHGLSSPASIARFIAVQNLASMRANADSSLSVTGRPPAL